MPEKLSVELREDFGKGAARRIRAEDKIPAVLYGHGQEPIHVTLPGHQTALAARNPNALLELTLADGRSRLALIKEIQRHPIRRTLTHIDFIEVRRGEKVEVDIPVVLNGEPVHPAIAVVDAQTLTLSVDALNVPEHLEIDVEEKEDGYQVFAGDVTLPTGAELVTDAELLVVAVQLPRVDQELEAELDAADEEAAAAAESEGSTEE
ncbi:50S ribosomal protein L25/general stress protein Ctc [Brachybacterium huguangmaarense]|uniref:Large ribosomal subunit protein bL25 n=1 Tax=Brachybacterium huguangmaarense TaxID=1652028 RepID=A0ABY6G0E1_9MICO|nr:50S ribosomal protein L25/general stress protein Ctc [Brachybacterium huguangmaarense]UYG16577.1 50S ribosomal protein L25/general stress protein Ctc [Brachybacterium huguangmaarense]